MTPPAKKTPGTAGQAPAKPSTPGKPTTPGKPAENSDGKAKRVRKTYAPIPTAALKAQPVPKSAELLILPGRERTDEQRVVDNEVKRIVLEWIEAGQPKSFRDMPKGLYELPPAQAETIRFMLNKAANYLNAKLRYGKPAYGAGGTEVVTFAALPRKISQWVDEPAKEAEPEEGKATEGEKPPESRPSA